MRTWILLGVGVVSVSLACFLLIPHPSELRVSDAPHDAPGSSASADGELPHARSTLETKADEPRQESIRLDGEESRLAAIGAPALPPGTSPAEIEFSPVPNAGKADFERKYAGLRAHELERITTVLRRKLNEEVGRLSEQRFELGLYDERVYPSADAANADKHQTDLLQGVGEVWPCEQATLLPSGMLAHRTTVLTEAEYPELFSHKAESLWVAHAYHHKKEH